VPYPYNTGFTNLNKDHASLTSCGSFRTFAPVFRRRVCPEVIRPTLLSTFTPLFAIKPWTDRVLPRICGMAEFPTQTPIMNPSDPHIHRLQLYYRHKQHTTVRHKRGEAPREVIRLICQQDLQGLITLQISNILDSMHLQPRPAV
jgi:hypothetical protein